MSKDKKPVVIKLGEIQSMIDECMVILKKEKPETVEDILKLFKGENHDKMNKLENENE